MFSEQAEMVRANRMSILRNFIFLQQIPRVLEDGSLLNGKSSQDLVELLVQRRPVEFRYGTRRLVANIPIMDKVGDLITGTIMGRAVIDLLVDISCSHAAALAFGIRDPIDR